MEAQLNSLIDAVRQAGADGRTLRLRGGGSKDFWGQSLTGEVLDTRAYQGIVSYEPSELVVTATPKARVLRASGPTRGPVRIPTNASPVIPDPRTTR